MASKDLRKKEFCGRHVYELEFRERSSMTNREARHPEGPAEQMSASRGEDTVMGWACGGGGTE